MVNLWRVGRVAALFFLLVLSLTAWACDPNSLSCPAVTDNVYMYGYTSNPSGAPASGFIFRTIDEAAAADCSAITGYPQVFNNQGACPAPNQTQTNTMTVSLGTCPSDQISRTISSASFKYDKLYTNSCLTANNTTYKALQIAIGSQLKAMPVCKDPGWPDGPDANNMCWKTCSALSGVRVDTLRAIVSGTNSGYVRAIQSEGYKTNGCMDSPYAGTPGHDCKINYSATGVCGSGTNGTTCTYDFGVFSGASCAASEPNQGKPGEGKCSEYDDGRLVCDGSAPTNTPPTTPPPKDVPKPDDNGTNCVTINGKNYCAEVTPPQDYCAANPSNPSCQNPRPQNCGFANGVYICMNADTGCGTFNGQNVCVDASGTVTYGGSGGGGSGGGTGGGTGDGSGDGDSSGPVDPAPLGDPEIAGLDDFQGHLVQAAPDGIAQTGQTAHQSFGVAPGVCSTWPVDLGSLGVFNITPICWFFEGIRALLTVIFSVIALGRSWRTFMEVF